MIIQKNTIIGESITLPFIIDQSRFLQYDYILDVLQSISKQLMPNYIKHNQNGQSQNKKQLIHLLYKALKSLFNGRSNNLSSSDKNNCLFFEQRPSQLCLYIQAFMDYLPDQSRLLSPDQLLNRINKKLKEFPANQQQKIQLISNSRSIGVKQCYRCKQQKNSRDRMYSFQCNTKIKKKSEKMLPIHLRANKPKWQENKIQIKSLRYEIIRLLQKQSGVNFINELLQAIMSIFYIENFIYGQRQPNKDFPHVEMHCPSYSKIAITKSFQLVIFQESKTLTIQVIVPKNEFTLMSRPQAKKYLDELTETITGTFNNIQAKFHNGLYLIDKENKLGKGSYGVVSSGSQLQLQRVSKQNDYQKTYWLSKSPIAIKKLPIQKRERSIPQNRQHLILTLLRQIQHKQAILSAKRQLGLFVRNSTIGASKIVQMYDYFRQQQHIFIVFEQLKPTNKDSMPKFKHLYNYSLSIWQSLHFLHHQIAEYYPQQLQRYFSLQRQQKGGEFSGLGKPIGICNRDFKPPNILLRKDENNSYAIIDFGFSRIMTQIQNKQQQAKSQSSSSAKKSQSLAASGSFYYMAPEISQGNYTYNIDLWSCGVLLYDKRPTIQNKDKFYYKGLQVKSIPYRREEIQTRLLSQSKRDIWSQFLSQSIRVDPVKRVAPKNGISFLLRNASSLQNSLSSNGKDQTDSYDRACSILQSSLWPISAQIQIILKSYQQFMNDKIKDIHEFIDFLRKVSVRYYDGNIKIFENKQLKQKADDRVGQDMWQYLRIVQVFGVKEKRYAIIYKLPSIITTLTDDLPKNLRFGIYLEKNITASPIKMHVFKISLNHIVQNDPNQNFDLIAEQIKTNSLLRTKCSLKKSFFWLQQKDEEINQNNLINELQNIYYNHIKKSKIRTKVSFFENLLDNSNLIQIANWSSKNILNINASAFFLFSGKSFIYQNKFKNILHKIVKETNGWTSNQLISFHFYLLNNCKEDVFGLIKDYQQDSKSFSLSEKIYQSIEELKNILYIFEANQKSSFRKAKLSRFIKGFKNVVPPSKAPNNHWILQLLSSKPMAYLIQSFFDSREQIKQNRQLYKIAQRAINNWNWLKRLLKHD